MSTEPRSETSMQEPSTPSKPESHSSGSESINPEEIYKICVMVPSSFLDPVKEAMFAAGAGRYGQYDCCCWQTLGTGQFRPLEGSQPFSGKPGKIHTEETWKVEIICEQQFLKQVIQALRQAHPYEMLAFDLYPVNLSVPEE